MLPSFVPFTQIVQYIRLVGPDSSGDNPYFYTSDGAGPYQWYASSGFGTDWENGHGTHTAGSAAGASLNNPAVTDTCTGTDELGCIGGCLNTSYVASLLNDYERDFDNLCPQFDCDGFGADYEVCLDEDVSATLTENGGVAQGAKLAIFDVSFHGEKFWGSLAGNGKWEVTDGTGCVLHSNSWGGDNYCTVGSEEVLYDEYMYEVCMLLHGGVDAVCCLRGVASGVAIRPALVPHTVQSIAPIFMRSVGRAVVTTEAKVYGQRSKLLETLLPKQSGHVTPSFRLNFTIGKNMMTAFW